MIQVIYNNQIKNIPFNIYVIDCSYSPIIKKIILSIDKYGPNNLYQYKAYINSQNYYSLTSRELFTMKWISSDRFNNLKAFL